MRTTTLADRLHTALAESGGLTQADLSRTCQLTSASVNDWFTGKTKELSAENLLNAADALGVSARWLATGVGPMHHAGHVGGKNPLHKAVAIPFCRPEIASEGGTITLVADERGEVALYPLAWLRREGLAAAHLRRIHAPDDAMAPCLSSGDWLLVNLAENSLAGILDGRVYAVSCGGALHIRRVYRKLDGTLVLRCDNPLFSTEEMSPEAAAQSLTLVGRVREKTGHGGL